MFHIVIIVLDDQYLSSVKYERKMCDLTMLLLIMTSTTFICCLRYGALLLMMSDDVKL